MIGEVLKQLDDERFIVKVSSGPRYVVGVRKKLDKAKLVSGTRVTLDMTTLTIMKQLPREVDPNVYQMLNEDPGAVSFSSVGGLNEQIRELREVIELPLTNPELFKRVGIKPPKVRDLGESVCVCVINCLPVAVPDGKSNLLPSAPPLLARLPPAFSSHPILQGVLLYGPPGTGKTLLARALACNIRATFIKVVASAIVDKYIGESARMIREMFGYAVSKEKRK
jgi:26S proteasome regulatory subunit T4